MFADDKCAKTCMRGAELVRRENERINGGVGVEVERGGGEEFSCVDKSDNVGRWGGE